MAGTVSCAQRCACWAGYRSRFDRVQVTNSTTGLHTHSASSSYGWVLSRATQPTLFTLFETSAMIMVTHVRLISMRTAG